MIYLDSNYKIGNIVLSFGLVPEFNEQEVMALSRQGLQSVYSS